MGQATTDGGGRYEEGELVLTWTHLYRIMSTPWQKRNRFSTRTARRVYSAIQSSTSASSARPNPTQS